MVMLLSALSVLLGTITAQAILTPTGLDSKAAKNVLEGKAEGYCSPSGPIESTHCAYETVESLNHKLFPAIHDLVNYPFFRHYKVDLYRECPFWYENAFCMNRDCGVEEADERDIPEKWRAKALGRVRMSDEEDDEEGVMGCYFREQDFCYIEDDATDSGQYIDLALNPERFTGYAGDSAQQVWRAIYEENCFGLSEASLELSSATGAKKASLASAVVGAASSLPSTGPAGGWGFSKLSEGWGTEMVKSPGSNEGTCEEKKVYYRVISGLHASISIHICQEYLDQTTGEWAPNLQCFISRLATHPERLSNVYFNAVLMLRAVARAAPYLKAYDIGTAPLGRLDAAGLAKRDEDRRAKETLSQVLQLAGSEGVAHGFDEGDFFAGEDAVASMILKEQFKTHFRNVSRIMDCVGCDKCRLWGKLQVSGLGTALKILFELDDKALDPKINPDLLQRSEVVALFNTLHRVSESLEAVEQFRQIYAETQRERPLPPAIAIESLPTSPRRDGSGRRPQQSKGDEGYAMSISTVLGVLVSGFEWFRRSCRGCLEVCWQQLDKSSVRDGLDVIMAWVRSLGQGAWAGRIEL